jgi:hypothetical protein
VPDGEPGLAFSWSPWTLIDDDDGSYSGTSSRYDLSEPEYPDGPDDYRQVGECVKGVIQFETYGKKITTIRYRNDFGGPYQDMTAPGCNAARAPTRRMKDNRQRRRQK